jgi:hypothetical protein
MRVCAAEDTPRFSRELTGAMRVVFERENRVIVYLEYWIYSGAVVGFLWGYTPRFSRELLKTTSCILAVFSSSYD